ncbi:MAG TPA: HAD family phosphatase [Firmicutes bacterium]|nr:HAD family phosphatase [Bacillota bacterium]
MKYKLLALDLDHTLLNKDNQISSRNIEAIRAVVDRGVMVTLATGRMFLSALPYAEELGIDLPLITYHGALIKQAGSGQILKHCPVPFEMALEILRLGEESNFHLNLYFNDRLFVKEENDKTRYYQQIASIPLETVGDLSSFLLQKGLEPTKLTIINMDGRLGEIQQILEKKFKPHLSILQSRPFFLEITHRDATKGQALDFLANKEGILSEEIIAMGDSYNDIDMLQYAGLGVAVANAPREVQNVADVITLSNVEDGVAVFLEKHILGKG